MTEVDDPYASLRDRVTIITGASSGLGAAFAESFARAGSNVVVAARRTERLDVTAEAVRSLGRSALVVKTDVSVPEQCSELVERAIEQFGRVDVLVNNAGISSAVPATRETPEQFRSIIDVNLYGSYWMAQACARVMQPQSSIINISSVLAVTTARLPQAAYTASKAALVGLTRDLAQQWGMRKGIRVNALAPGYFETEMTEAYDDEYVTTVLLPRIVLGRAGLPAELAATAVWLASPGAGYITGQTILVDGGMSIA
ncbi:SDR family NAD(P)-dependent oxidoreductase [Subtercola frigoramans]|uniref:NAD(P)-dependent dehydrogenase (Short-subunit alcohol dehydrogenase family) n=1 Tax=Subtercola frigoramans TaxID=120298 RepID=A0ABS2L716_9MICO|nr:glucose 1-dehydrogenase [Subtercola frigoramans]MBM7472878.1 NAD(P)-dependent dehydrogenase (short-subunit alcohol dehydrogenase family) [Subtercola frigoramans]